MKYISKFLELRIVVKPAYSKEIDGRVVVTQGKSIQFHDGVYNTEDSEEITFLDNNKNLGNVFIKVEGDIKKAKEKLSETLEERNDKITAKKKKKIKKEKALEEGSELAKNKIKKEEKPAY